MAIGHKLFFLFFSITLFFIPSLNAVPLDFRSCQLKYQVSSIDLQDTFAFAVDGQYALFYSKEKPKHELVKRDPFLGLNLIRTSQTFKHIFKFYHNEPEHLAGIYPSEVLEGKLISEQIGLSTLARFSVPLRNNMILTGTCCGVMGISTEEGIIDKEYIRHFLESKKVLYGDIGIRIADKEGVRVVEVDPFFETSPFLLDDIIVAMDEEKIPNAAVLSRRILFSKPQSEHDFVIIREGKKIGVKAYFQQKRSGGLIPESFFEFFDLQLDENLTVVKDAPIYEIKRGDKLMYVMDKKVGSLADIRSVLSHEKRSKNKVVKLLFRRNGFDFFIYLDKPSDSK